MAKLVINPTSASKKEIPLVSRVISIGRDPTNDLVLSDSMVSRRHAILEQRDDVFVLRDNNSSNGTMVNGDRVDEEKALQDGDLVAIGSSRLLFQLDETGEASTAPPMAIGSETREVSEPKSAPAPPAVASRDCPSCGKSGPASDRFCRNCGHRIDGEVESALCSGCGASVRLPAEFCGRCGKALPGAMPPKERAVPASMRREPRAPSGARGDGQAQQLVAGLGVRLVAGIVDAMILGIPILLVALVWVTLSSPTSSAASRPLTSFFLAFAGGSFLVLAALYFVFFWGMKGATPGMSLLGLTIETEDGQTPIGLGRAAIRVAAGFIGLLPLGLGFFRIALASDGLAFHDRLTETRVFTGR